MNRERGFLTAGLLLACVSVHAEPEALTQLRMAAESAESSVHASNAEAAASANEKWAENGGGAVAVPAAYASGAAASAAAVPTPSPAFAPSSIPPARPNLTAEPPAVPGENPANDPVPPKIKGWTGFYLGFLGTEAKALTVLSGTGKAAIPLLILAQPLVAPAALVVGLLGIFGIRL